MAKFAHIEDSPNPSYTQKTLRNISPVPFGTTNVADIILLTINDVSQYPWMLKMRDRYKDKIIIAGGSQAYTGQSMVHLADGVNVGEGFEFFKKLHEIADLPAQKILDEFENEPYFITKHKVDEEITPSEWIDWNQLTCARQGKNLYYYLYSRGCRGKCKFCYTSWTQHYQANDSLNLQGILADFTKHPSRSLNLVSNDDTAIDNLTHTNIAAKSIMIKQFLATPPQKFKKTTFFHFGIEAFTEKVRAWIGKPITNAQLGEAIMKLGKLRKNAELFFILGFPDDDPEEFIESIPGALELYPRLFMQIRYLEPTAHTPLWRWPITEPEVDFDEDEFFKHVSSINRRFRVRSVRGPYYAAWRTVINRIPPEAVPAGVKWSKIKSMKKLKKAVTDAGFYDYLYPPKNLKLANENIKCPWDDQLRLQDFPHSTS